MDNLGDFEAFLLELEDENVFDECVEFLVRTIGGTSMRYVVMSNFSMSGRGGTKPAFEGLPIAKLISTAALRAAEKAGLSAMGTAVKKSIREHLRYAALRKN